ncbi:MAG TPA: transposase [Candidatus Lokiarchaeia archaeon]|nr:transposase [Candidatus Lokiarchaeia archaeon]
MQLADRVQVRKTPALSLLCHRAKNLHNLANFYVRQELFHLEAVLTYYDLDFMLRGSPAYQALPAQTAQQVLRQVAGEWHAFFAACKAYRNDPRKFLGAPRPPRYKPRGGESIAIFTNQQCRIRGGWLHFPAKAGLPPVCTRVQVFQQVRVVPKGLYYVIEIVYNREATDLGLDKRRALGVDLGVVNLVTAASNAGVAPFAIKGGSAKSANQFYNKRLAQLRSITARVNDARTTRRIARLSWIRNNKIRDIFHKVSRAVVDFCVQHNIGTLAVGYNPRWKQGSHLGRRVNQSFVGLPFLDLVRQIQYKAALQGIAVILVDERYTSRCSALDGETIGRHAQYAGRRVRRGLFQTQTGTLINADVNAAYNILRQAVPEAFADGIEGVGLHPVLVALA